MQDIVSMADITASSGNSDNAVTTYTHHIESWQTTLNLPEISIKNELKIVIAGNVGAGKSTSIRTISEIPVVCTEAKATESAALYRKNTTTTAMDYGIAHIANTKLHLYGAPGQRRFDFMGDILCKGADGIVVMIDNGGPDSLREVDYCLTQYGHFLKTSPGVIAITHLDDTNANTTLFDYHHHVLKHGFNCPVVPLDARSKPDVHKVLQKLLHEIGNTTAIITDEKIS